MDFKLVSKASAVKGFREGTYSQELMDAVKELWQIQQEHGDTHVTETEPFKDEETALKWMKKAQAYGKTQGLFVHQARGYVPSAPNALVLWVEKTDERQQRIAERKAKEAEKAEEKAGQAAADTPAGRLQAKAAEQKAAAEAGKAQQGQQGAQQGQQGKK